MTVSDNNYCYHSQSLSLAWSQYIKWTTKLTLQNFERSTRFLYFILRSKKLFMSVSMIKNTDDNTANKKLTLK